MSFTSSYYILYYYYVNRQKRSPMTNQTITGLRLTGYSKRNAFSSNRNVDGSKFTGSMHSIM